MNPVRNETYAALWQFLREAAGLFPDSYMHLGGDEVPFDCWQVLLLPPLSLPKHCMQQSLYDCCHLATCVLLPISASSKCQNVSTVLRLDSNAVELFVWGLLLLDNNS